MGTSVKTVACFGGSAVLGQGDQELHIGWAGRLGDDFIRANQEENESTPAFYNLGVLGETACKLVDRIEPELALRRRTGHGRQTMSIVSIGLNDSLTRVDGLPLKTPLEFAGQVERIVHGARRYSDQVLCMGFTAFDEARTNPFKGRDAIFRLDRSREFEKIALEVSSAMGATALSLFDKSIAAGFTTGGGLLASDGLHPNSWGHKWIRAQVSPIAETLWRSPPHSWQEEASKTETEADHYRATVVAGAVIEQDAKYLLLRSVNPKTPGKWGFPGGKVNMGETFEQAVVREAKEECGVDIVPDIHLLTVQKDAKSPVLHAFSARITNGEIMLSPQEADAFAWLSLEEIRMLERQDELGRAEYTLSAILAHQQQAARAA